MADREALRGIIARWTGDVDPTKVGSGLGGELAQRKLMQDSNVQSLQPAQMSPMSSPAAAPAPMDLVNPNYVPRGGQAMLDKVLSGQMDQPMQGVKKVGVRSMPSRPLPQSPDTASY